MITPEEQVQSLQREVVALREALSGWNGYSWKDGEYIDDLQEYFDSVKLKALCKSMTGGEES